MDCSLPGSSVHGIFQARVLEWGAIAFSTLDTRWQQKKKKSSSLLELFTTQHYCVLGHLINAVKWIIYIVIYTQVHSIKYNWEIFFLFFFFFASACENTMKVIQSCLTFCDPMDYTVHGILQARIPEWVYWSGQSFLSSEDLPNPGIKPRSPALQMDSLPAEPQETPKNTGVSSLSLFQWIFPTQELNQDLLRCRQILYQLSYQGSLKIQ